MSSLSNSPSMRVMPTGRMLTAFSEFSTFVAQSLIWISPFANPSLCAIHFLTLDTGSPEGTKRVQSVSSGCWSRSTRILSRFPLAMITVIPSSATYRAMFVLVSMPPLPKLDLEVWI